MCQGKKSKTGLLNVEWLRLVLDESHTVRNANSKTFETLKVLKRVFTWCVSGTPIVNSVNDLYAYLCLIRCEPLHDVEWWRKLFLKPITKAGDAAALANLRVLVMKLVLRRTKQSKDADGRLLLSLPPKELLVRRVNLNAEEVSFFWGFHFLLFLFWFVLVWFGLLLLLLFDV